MGDGVLLAFSEGTVDAVVPARDADPLLTDAAAALVLLSVDAGADVTVYRVGTAVNAVRNNGPELLVPAG